MSRRAPQASEPPPIRAKRHDILRF